jgi:hypothetical protein
MIELYRKKENTTGRKNFFPDPPGQSPQYQPVTRYSTAFSPVATLHGPGNGRLSVEKNPLSRQRDKR